MFVICIVSLLVTPLFPAFADRTVSVVKKVDVTKELFCDTFTNLDNYSKIFPEFVQSVKLDNDENLASFSIKVSGTTYNAKVKSLIQPDCKYVLDVVSGELKGSRIITTLDKTWGFDGTAGGGTIIKSELKLEIPWYMSPLLLFIGDEKIKSALGDGFYKIAQYTKINSVNIENPTQNVVHE
ncbi:MAG TPA: hypothetical protein VD699_04745 [Nitrosopumilaceae archaeon]|nr:hypothetical protein [Nitrosopumilaceae archaeon]